MIKAYQLDKVKNKMVSTALNPTSILNVLSLCLLLFEL